MAGCEFKGDVTSVSDENLHDFEIISPARRVQTHPRTPPHPSAYGPVFNV